ncbi:piRNA biogenesis protein EXD1-like [Argopecten irradians]|uniref:piRNA biogenesis protein EXD1-like n=1 Tax=Argopecten irradians TaxID=31199 RepID=UPI0037202C03
MATADSRRSENFKIIPNRNMFNKSGVKHQLLQSDVLALDTEYSTSKEGVRLSLIQIATPDKHVFVFDVLKDSEITEELRLVLESDKIEKVMHDCLNDSKALWEAHGIKLTKVFDTKVVHQIVESKQTQTILKHVKPVGLDSLCTTNDIAFNAELKRRVKRELQQDPCYFLRRNTDGSLPDEIKEYAVQDVTVLLDLHTKMKRILTDDMAPLHQRLVPVSLYAHLNGVACRRSYERDTKLLDHVAAPELTRR